MVRKPETVTQLQGTVSQIQLHKYILTFKLHEIKLYNCFFTFRQLNKSKDDI